MAAPFANDFTFEEEIARLELDGPSLPVSLTMTIDSNTYSMSSGLEGRPNLTFTLTSDFCHPITICTFRSALDELHAWHGMGHHQNFSATDISTGNGVWFEGSQPQRRSGLKRQLGTNDAKSFVTLLPSTPVTVTYPVQILCDSYGSASPYKRLSRNDAAAFPGESFRDCFEPGHSYKLGLAYRRRIQTGDPNKWSFMDFEPYQIKLWWRYGTKEQVLEPMGSWGAYLGWSERKIRIGGIPSVELAIEE